ncbi:hypothetical protein AYR62_13615 [Secundilactobacillus paracollinoides]|uniref:Uncharacterized protein n=1 Tax=Secundilactobacillus paracollinoides TaxID=240427 RepID=A0A1B2IWR7_9LACO|nr:UPF0158 family protein [Secundilactobacillus paracollinoides]ANZ60640.1 hypothetical protein AYR61_04310 [Secundilactobacillus paracollinoides]ANZ65013.1 hypothetical protein AYR62_13615 [Secundilactobacillus paracollinoides]ANZ66483.1 hypothetical protein AYR63_04595 [Secundilactobacillus paracollinoides]KRL78818.1 hypothetical protein FC17_GL000833 [Secundilactobacillus paracollinoides DSM 15502 = JCM 11969]
MKVKLDAVLEALTFASDDGSYYYNTKTGEIQYASSEFDGDLEYEELDENPDQYIELPGPFDIDDYSIMRDFINSLPAGDQQTDLANSIRGRGAFRSFRATLDRFGITDKWYTFKDDAYRQIAIDWCNDNHIEYEE